MQPAGYTGGDSWLAHTHAHTHTHICMRVDTGHSSPSTACAWYPPFASACKHPASAYGNVFRPFVHVLGHSTPCKYTHGHIETLEDANACVRVCVCVRVSHGCIQGGVSDNAGTTDILDVIQTPAVAPTPFGQPAQVCKLTRTGMSACLYAPL